jgi:predicted DNA-binding protein with PD1-like motif
MEMWEDARAGVVIVALRRGDLVWESLAQVAREKDIHTGVVMSGIGSLTKARIHTVASNDYPPAEDYYDLEGPLEVVQFGGIIANYEPHIHLSLWDKDRNYFGGHMHEGCEILTLSEISILRCPDLRVTRRQLDESGVWLLDKQ